MNKKIKVFLFVFVSIAALIICFAVDSEYKPVAFDKVNLYTQHAAYPEGTKEIECKWSNKSNVAMTYGYAFNLQKLGELDWVDVIEKGGYGWVDLGMGLTAYSARTQVYNLEQFTDYITAGKYRIKTKCHIGGELVQVNGQHTVYAYFTVE